VRSSPRVANYITAIVGILVALVADIVTGQSSTILATSLYTVGIFVIVGILNFGISRILSYVGVKNIGATQASVLSLTQVLYSFIFAVVLIGETLTVETAAGAALIILGALIIEGRPTAKPRGGTLKIGIISILLGSIVRGFAPVLIKVGLVHYPFSVSATLISYLGAMLFNAALIAPGKAISAVKALPRNALLSVTAAGVFVVVAQLLRFAALDFASVILVAPMTAMEPIFTVLISQVVAKEFEVIHKRTVLSIIFVVLGGMIVSYSSSIG
ncbi:MAG: DMT family transporter, partial [Thaumarchaeota archaeon]|nr:DMT family transporter [Nitrososphaerota archaeon]